MDKTVTRQPLRRAVVKEKVLETIVGMGLRPGDRLISEKQFAERLGVNRLTLRAAYAELTDNGVLERRQGSGTYVNMIPGADAVGGLRKSGDKAAVLVMREDSHFFGGVVNAISAELQSREYLSTMLTYSGEFSGGDSGRLDKIRQMGISNLIFENSILYHSGDFDAEPLLRGFRRAVGVLGWMFDSPLAPDFVVSGDYAGAYREAIIHLKSKGHRKIAFCGGLTTPGFRLARSNSVLAGFYTAAMIDCGLAEHICIRGELIDGNYDSVRALLSSSECPTAIFCDMDYRAVKIIDMAREMGLKIPEDLSIIGFYDTPWAEHYKLTSFRFRTRQMAEKVVGLIVDHGCGPEIFLEKIDMIDKDSVGNINTD